MAQHGFPRGVSGTEAAARIRSVMRMQRPNAYVQQLNDAADRTSSLHTGGMMQQYDTSFVIVVCQSADQKQLQRSINHLR